MSASASAPRFILLLPPLPQETDEQLVRGVYGDTLRQVLQEVALASKECQPAAILEIALACPHLGQLQSKSKFSHYHETQKLVAQAYRLICIIAAQDKINIEDTAGVDVRILLVAWDPKSPEHTVETPANLVVSIPGLVASQRPWQYAFGVENDAGEAMVRAFVGAKNGDVEGSTFSSSGPAVAGQDSVGPIPCVAVGGTFDHLHIGHKLLLTMTVFGAIDLDPIVDQPRSVIVGITGDELLKNKKFAEHLESWHDRQKAVYDFVDAIIDFSPPGAPQTTSREVTKPGPNGHAVDIRFNSGLLLRCVEIGDPFGPTITESGIDGLIISAETRSGGKAVNDKRAEQGWQALEVLEVDVLDATESQKSTTAATGDAVDFAGKISSTEIRRKLSNKGNTSLL